VPLNQRKIVEIILRKVQDVDEKCSGYREEIQEVIVDIIEYERQHRVQGTNIQQKVNGKIDAAGRYLAEHMLK
jgi:predicted transcriptional regulator